MFWKLFNYISGENKRQVKIPMTAPVSVLVQPSTDDECEAAADLQTTFTMAFYIPAPFDQDPPQPDDSSVTIEYRPELRIFVRFVYIRWKYFLRNYSVIVFVCFSIDSNRLFCFRTYGGFTNDRIDQEERCHLLASLSAEDRELVIEQQSKPGGGVYYCAGYDPPLKLFFRRNEIWFPIVVREEPNCAVKSSEDSTIISS